MVSAVLTSLACRFPSAASRLAARSGASCLHLTVAELHCRTGPRYATVRVSAAAGSSSLAGKKCVPCEEDGGSLGYMGLCEAMDRGTAEQLLKQLDGWELQQDDQGRLHLQRSWRTKNFVKGLALCQRIAAVAEAEGHHPDLHLTDWNKLTVNIWTHARNGVTENDFILAAKLEAIGKEGLLRGKRKTFADI